MAPARYRLWQRAEPRGAGHDGLAGGDPLLVFDDVSAVAALFAGRDVWDLHWRLSLPSATDWQWVAAGFVIFRILDMWKPWPIRWFDRNVHGGMGIMIDDIVAGVISAGILYFIGHHWPLGII